MTGSSVMNAPEPVLQLPAPAKLNLFLHITGRRPDGYHELQTVFQLLNYGDSLSFTPSDHDSVSLSCSNPTLQTPDNLVLRAAAMLRPYARRYCGMQIHLLKRLPAGGGLGGGSSDAATTLVALNELWDCGLDQGSLMTLGASLGADVPVFVFGHSAWAQGVGERLEKMELPELWYVVLTPACHASTARIFGHPELTRDSAPLRIPRFPFPGTRNDCQAVATLLHPEIQQALDWLELQTRFEATGKTVGTGASAGTGQARMTGTGSSVFMGFDTHAAAAEVLARWEAEVDASAASGFVAQACNQSPLYRRP